MSHAWDVVVLSVGAHCSARAETFFSYTGRTNYRLGAFKRQFRPILPRSKLSKAEMGDEMSAMSDENKPTTR